MAWLENPLGPNVNIKFVHKNKNDRKIQKKCLMETELSFKLKILYTYIEILREKPEPIAA